MGLFGKKNDQQYQKYSLENKLFPISKPWGYSPQHVENAINEYTKVIEKQKILINSLKEKLASEIAQKEKLAGEMKSLQMQMSFVSIPSMNDIQEEYIENKFNQEFGVKKSKASMIDEELNPFGGGVEDYDVPEVIEERPEIKKKSEKEIHLPIDDIPMDKNVFYTEGKSELPEEPDDESGEDDEYDDDDDESDDSSDDFRKPYPEKSVEEILADKFDEAPKEEPEYESEYEDNESEYEDDDESEYEDDKSEYEDEDETEYAPESEAEEYVPELDFEHKTESAYKPDSKDERTNEANKSETGAQPDEIGKVNESGNFDDFLNNFSF